MTLRVTVTGATGLIGPALLAALQADGAEVTVLSRNPDRARAALDATGPPTPVEVLRWDLMNEPAPAATLAGRDAVVHLAGENVAQRWTTSAKEAIRESRVRGTGHLLDGLRESQPRPRALISASAIGYYGPHGEEPLDEDAPPGRDFLAEVCAAWEAQAGRASELGMRVVQVRTGVVLDRNGGALGKMLAPFRLGLGGPVAGGRQYMSWIHREDEIGMILAAIKNERWAGPINATAPEPVSNRDFSRALGRALGRPALLPVPGLALRMLYGEMAEIVTTGARVVPAKPLVLGFEFRHPELQEALSSALAPG
ncbi:MAG: TIGR01777 family oxidoreductase [Solirubrobacteraceae bacterium]|jgi:uncharacterized protein (TIGR01777 family)